MILDSVWLIMLWKISLSVTISFPNDINNTSWWLIAIYGPISRNNRDEFWVDVEEIKSICLPNWLMGGDFNVVRWKSKTTAKNLQKRLPSWSLKPSWCVMCKTADEDKNQVFISCPFANDIWKKVGALFNRSFIFEDTTYLCKYIYRSKVKAKNQTILLNTVAVILWSIWNERNKKIFNDVKNSPLIWEDIQALIGF